MARRRPPREPDDGSSMPSLTISREEVRRHLNEQIEKGKNLLQMIPERGVHEQMPYGVPSGFERVKDEYKNWHEYNGDLLKSIYNNPIISQSYEQDYDINFRGNEVSSLRDRIGRRIRHLESLAGRLSLYKELPQAAQRRGTTVTGNDVFIVHGHDEGIKQQVARFIEKLGLSAVILHEQPNKGRTLIEKFEDYSSVAFAVVLLTPDDMGGIAPDQLQPRARQNVILELGIFLGKLDREHVCALYSKGVELPSDLQGVVYVPLDDAGAWRLLLAKELKAAGFDFDMNKAL